MNEWKVERTKRKDTRNFKDPSLDKEPTRYKSKKDKPFKVVAYPTLENKYVKEPHTAGHFAKEKDAQKSIDAKMQDVYMSKYYTYKIVKGEL